MSGNSLKNFLYILIGSAAKSLLGRRINNGIGEANLRTPILSILLPIYVRCAFYMSMCELRDDLQQGLNGSKIYVWKKSTYKMSLQRKLSAKLNCKHRMRRSIISSFDPAVRKIIKAFNSPG